MAGAFDGLMTDTGAMRNLTPEQLATVRAQRQGDGALMGGSSTGPGTGRQWWSNLPAEDPNSFTLNYMPGYRELHGGDAQEWGLDPALDNTFITRLRPNTGGNLGDRWDENGVYQGTAELQNGGGRDFNQAVALIAGGYFGGNALAGVNGAGAAAGATGSTAAEQIAFLSANGMTDAAIAQAYPALAQAGGLTGVGGGAAATAAGGGATDWGSQLKTGLSTVGDGLKSVGLTGGDLLRTGAAFALAKDVDAPQADPNLTKAITGLTGTADAANARAQSNDEYWRTTFAPRYLRAMDDQIAMGRQLSDFNMGLAKKYDDRYWNTTAKQQDAFYDKVNTYDTDAARARFAGEAGANSDMQSAAAMQALVRDLNRRGVNPNSGAVISGQRQHWQQSALQKTMAINMAREAARKEGLNMRAVAAGLGGNLTGASAGFAGQAGQAAGLGMQGIGGANSGFNSSVGNWNATTGVGIGAMNSVGNWGLGLTNGNTRANELNTQGWNQLVGYGLGMFGSGRGG